MRPREIVVAFVLLLFDVVHDLLGVTSKAAEVEQPSPAPLQLQLLVSDVQAQILTQEGMEGLAKGLGIFYASILGGQSRKILIR